ncbi:MAG: phenylacetate--CoA ligase, partial [Pseudomonadota bacterium]
RYRTRDLTRLLPGTARSMRRMEKVTGRSDDMMIVRGVNIFPTQIEEQVMATPGLAPHFQIELSRDARMDQMRILCEAQLGQADAAARTHAAADLSRRVKDTIGIRVAVDIADPGSVARSEGKAVRIIDRRG